VEEQKNADKIFEKSDHDLSPHSQRDQVFSSISFQRHQHQENNDHVEENIQQVEENNQQIEEFINCNYYTKCLLVKYYKLLKIKDEEVCCK
jgi:hypothetical protein